MQNNGSVYLHAFFAPSGLSIDPSDPFYKEDTVFSKTFSARMLCPITFLASCKPRQCCPGNMHKSRRSCSMHIHACNVFMLYTI